MSDNRPEWEISDVGRVPLVEIYCRACNRRDPLAKVYRYEDGTLTLSMPVYWSRGLGPDRRGMQGSSTRGEFLLSAAAERELHCKAHGVIGLLVSADLAALADAARAGQPGRLSL